MQHDTLVKGTQIRAATVHTYMGLTGRDQSREMLNLLQNTCHFHPVKVTYAHV